MARFRGTVRRSDLEGGLYTLEADDGEVYQIEWSAGALKPGARVEIEGSVDKNAMSFGMSGPILKAKQVKAL